MARNGGTVTLERSAWRVPDEYAFGAGLARYCSPRHRHAVQPSDIARHVIDTHFEPLDIARHVIDTQFEPSDIARHVIDTQFEPWFIESHGSL